MQCIESIRESYQFSIVHNLNNNICIYVCMYLHSSQKATYGCPKAWIKIIGIFVNLLILRITFAQMPAAATFIAGKEFFIFENFSFFIEIKFYYFNNKYKFKIKSFNYARTANIFVRNIFTWEFSQDVTQRWIEWKRRECEPWLERLVYTQHEHFSLLDQWTLTHLSLQPFSCRNGSVSSSAW